MTLRSNRKIIKVFILFVFYFIVMFPFVNYTYTNDDSVNRFLYDRVQTSGKNIFQYSISEVVDQYYKGRIQPIGLTINSFFWYLQLNELQYWIYKFVAILLSMLSFSILVNLWIKDWINSLSLSFLFSLFIQARAGHDALLNYAYMPIIAALGFLGLTIGLKGIKANSIHQTLLCNAIILFDILWYEISICFSICLFILALVNKKKKIASVHFSTFLSFLILTLIVRKTYSSEVNTMSLNNPLKFVEATIHQIGGMLPLNHFIFSWPSIIKDFPFFPRYPVSFLSALIAISFIYLLDSFGPLLDQQENSCNYPSTKSRTLAYQTSDYTKKELLIVSLSLILIPTLMIVAVERYRNNLTGGNPYITVYLGYFGILMLFYFFKDYLIRKNTKFLLFAGLILGLQYYQNTSMVEIQNYKWHRGFQEFLNDSLIKNKLNNFFKFKKIYLKDQLCNDYFFPMLSDHRTPVRYWFKNRFHKVLDTECLSSAQLKYPYLDLNEDRKHRKYTLIWAISNNEVQLFEWK